MDWKALAMVVVLLLLLLLLPQVSAQTFKAEMKFYVESDGETYYAGESVMRVTLENAASLEMHLQNLSSASEMIFLLTTAKNVRLEFSDTSCVDVLNEEIVLGDVPAGKSISLPIPIKVLESCVSELEESEESIPLKITYEQVVIQGNALKYESGVLNTDVEIKIGRRDYDVAASVLNSVHPGISEVLVEITNTGKEEIKNAVVILNSTPPLIPESFSSFIEYLKPGDARTVKFKVYVPPNTIPQTYPAGIVLSYEKLSGLEGFLTKSIGIKVEGEGRVKAEVVRSYIPHLSVAELKALRGFIEMKITNEGDEMRDASAILKIDAPIKVENSPFIGKLGKGESRIVTFYVTSSAPPGSYTGHVAVKYRNSFGDEVVSGEVWVEISVSSSPPIAVREVNLKNLLPGQVGEVEVDLTGAGLRNVRLELLPSDIIKPISPVYFLPDGNGRAAFRVEVSRSAVSGTHLVHLAATFDAENVSDISALIDLPVIIRSERVQFEVAGVRGELHPDSTGEVVIAVKNTGDVTMHDAVMLLSITQLLSIAGESAIGSLIGKSQPGEYFVGDLKPGEVKEAVFRITVDKDAGEGNYPAEVRLRYYDESNFVHTSDSRIVSLRVTTSPPYILIAASVIALIGVAIAVNFARKRRNRKKG